MLADGGLSLELALDEETVHARTEAVDPTGLDELSRALDNDGDAMSAFDVERYGEMIESEGLTACQRFYIDQNVNGPDLSWYDLDDFESKYGWGYGWGEDGDEDDRAA